MSLIDKINGSLLRQLSGAGQSAASSSSNSSVAGRGVGSTFDGSQVDLSSGLARGQAAFRNSILRINNAVGQFSIAKALVGELDQLAGRMLELANQATEDFATSGDRARLNQEFQHNVVKFRDLVSEVSNADIDYLSSAELEEVLSNAGIDPNAASRLARLFGAIGGEDERIAKTTFDYENVVVTTRSSYFQGTGALNAQTNNALAGAAGDTVSADFNGDNILDAAASSAGNIDILLGNGDGTFDAYTTYSATAGGASKLITSDYNGDGIADLATAGGTTGVLDVFLGTGTGTFKTATSYAITNGATDLAQGDFNRDNILDIIAANASTNEAEVLLGNGDGTFQAAANFVIADSADIGGLAVADVNNDGLLDLLASARADAELNVLLGNGDGTFDAHVSYAVDTSPGKMALIDSNGDGYSDVAVLSETDDTVNVLLGNANGTFQAAVSYAVSADPRDIKAEDLNGDGYRDLVVGTDSSTVDVLLANSNGTFQAAVSRGSGNPVKSITTGDFNRDGVADVLASIGTTNTLSYFGGGRTASESIATEFATPRSTVDPLSQDLTTKGGALIAVNILSALKEDLERDLSAINGVLNELGKVLNFSRAGESAFGQFLSIVSETNPEELTAKIVLSIRNETLDSSLGSHSDLDTKLAAELLGAG